MPKGRKFTAAEKHFREKEEKLLKENRRTLETLNKAVEAVADLKKENDALKAEVESLKEQVAFFADKADMSPEELKRLIESQRRLGAAANILLSHGGCY